MRVLVLTNLYPNPYHLTRAPFNRHQMRILAESHAVRIIAPISWTDEWKARWRGAMRLPPDRRVTHDGLLVEHPQYRFPPRFLRQFYGHFFYASVKRAFFRALEEFKPELIFTPWAYPDGWASAHLARKVKLPVVIQVHGSDVLLLEQFPARKKNTIRALKEADAIVAVSQDIANHLIRLGIPPERIQVIYDGVDYQLFCPGPQRDAQARLGIAPGDPLLVFIGNLVAVKAINVLLKACAILNDQGQPFRLYIIGQGTLRAALENQTEQLKLTPRVHFMGSLPQAQLPDWYRAADLFILPSHSEGVPNVLLEASACETPYVASSVGGIPEIAHLGQSQLVPPNNPPELAKAIQKSLSTPRTKTAQRPRAREGAVAELETLFHKVMASAALPNSGNLSSVRA